MNVSPRMLRVRGGSARNVPFVFLGIRRARPHSARVARFTAALPPPRPQGECPTPEALVAFRASPPFASFLKRWNLSAYFSLRYQARSLPEALADRGLRSCGSSRGSPMTHDPPMTLDDAHALTIHKPLCRIISSLFSLRRLRLG